MMVSFPSQVDPRDIFLVVEFVQEFHEKGFILNLEVDDPEATMFLRSVDHVPCGEGITLVSLFNLLGPEASSPDLVQNLY